MKLGRRQALKVIAATGAMAAGSVAPASAARARREPPPDALGMLYDTTKCIGCKACVVACTEANHLEVDTSWSDGLYQAPLDLNGKTKNVIKLYREGPYQSYVKAQCMHCVDPACTSACMLGSLKKDPVTGIVTYDQRYCVGCRYCMMACPFNVTKFEYHKVAPNIVKCELCRHRFAEATLAETNGFSRFPANHGPACCEVCPREAVIYGKRSELLAEAKRRLAEHPDRYVPKIYGEDDAGGTQVLYLSHVPFEKIGLPDFGPRGVPHTAYTVQEGLYQGFVAPVALYGALAFVMWRNRKKGGQPADAAAGKGEAS
ncbi:MAG: hydrogenase 2 operon protein HybA [Acidobacteria bacterium]|nr:hydrogenase 2 operon protein HybA [Acidobacteriota bacterium]